MVRPCKVHALDPEKRLAVEDMILAGKSLRQIATYIKTEFKEEVSFHSIHRHAQHHMKDVRFLPRDERLRRYRLQRATAWSESEQKLSNEILILILKLSHTIANRLGLAIQKTNLKEAQEYLRHSLTTELIDSLDNLTKFVYETKSVKHPLKFANSAVAWPIIDFISNQFFDEEWKLEEAWFKKHAPHWAKPYAKWLPNFILVPTLILKKKDEAMKELEQQSKQCKLGESVAERIRKKYAPVFHK